MSTNKYKCGFMWSECVNRYSMSLLFPRVTSAGCLTAASSSSSSASSPSPVDQVGHTKHVLHNTSIYNTSCAYTLIVLYCIRVWSLVWSWFSGGDHGSAGWVLHPVLQTSGVRSGLQHQLGGAVHRGDALPAPCGRSNDLHLHLGHLADAFIQSD